MKIINQTSSEILISAPKSSFTAKMSGFIFPFVFGSLFTFMPMMFLVETLSRTGILRVNCDRVEPQQVDCQISKSKYFDLVQQEPLNYKFVNSAKYNVIDEGKDSDGNKVYRYNFSLLTKSGERVPFESVKSSTANSVVVELNPFFLSKQESFKYILDERTDPFVYISTIFFIPFFAVGFTAILAAFSSLVDHVEILLDKSENQLRYTKRSLLGTKVNLFPFNEISKVDVLYATDSYKNIFFTTRININSKVQFKLDTVSNLKVAIKIANDLNRFMGLPEEEDPVAKE